MRAIIAKRYRVEIRKQVEYTIRTNKMANLIQEICPWLEDLWEIAHFLHIKTVQSHEMAED